MRLKNIFAATAIFLGAFLLFYPQTSKALSCACSLSTSIYGIGTVKFSCTEIQEDTLVPHYAADCNGLEEGMIKNDPVVVGGIAYSLPEKLRAAAYDPETRKLTYDILTSENFNCTPCSAEGLKTDSGKLFSEVEADLNARKPILEVNIPGVNFSDVGSSTDETGTYFYIAWLPEFITALYKFLLAIVSIVAAVVIVIQGVRVIGSGGGEGKTEAYKKILQAVIGLFIAWGSYAILYNINPALVQFNALKVKVVTRAEFPQETEMMENEVDTEVAEDDETPEPETGSYTPKFSSCPIALENPVSTAALSDRTKEFFEKIQSSGVITGTTEAERILQVGDAAVVCKIAMGNCGRTAGDIYTLAGVTTKKYPDTSCLLQKKNKKLGIKSTGCGTHFDKEYRHIPSKYIAGKENILSKGLPIAEVAKTLLEDSTLKKAGWPDSWARELKPGDAIWVYNGNSSGGNHSAIFVGWKNGSFEAAKGKAQVIQGSAGKTTFRGYPICITTECGAKMKSIVKTMKVQH